MSFFCRWYFFIDTATAETYTYCHTLSVHDALPISLRQLALLETHGKRFLDLGKAPAARERCSLTALVGEGVELLRPQCRHSGIELRWGPPVEEIGRAHV